VPDTDPARCGRFSFVDGRDISPGMANRAGQAAVSAILRVADDPLGIPAG
jgi:hypothetical protein